MPVVQGHNYSLAITRRLLVKHLQDVLKSHQPILEKRNRFMMTKNVSLLFCSLTCFSKLFRLLLQMPHFVHGHTL